MRRIDHCPYRRGIRREHQHRPQKRPGNAVGDLQHLGAIGEGAAHQGNDACVASVGADAVDALHHGASQVDAAGDRVVARLFSDGKRLAGQQRLVDLGRPLQENAVGRKRLTR